MKQLFRVFVARLSSYLNQYPWRESAGREQLIDEAEGFARTTYKLPVAAQPIFDLLSRHDESGAFLDAVNLVSEQPERNQESEDTDWYKESREVTRDNIFIEQQKYATVGCKWQER